VRPLIIRFRVALACLFTVEASYQKHIFSGDGFDAACRNGDAAGFCELQHRTFDARVVPAVIRAVEFCYPQAIVVFDDSFRTRTAHRRADQDQILGLRSFLGFVIVLAHQRFSDFLELREFYHIVELAPRRWWLLVKAEAECARAVIR